MNNQFKLVLFFLFISILTSGQEITDKIDFELPAGIEAEDLINYEFNDTTKQYNLTFFKEKNSKKGAIQLLTLNDQFQLVEKKEFEMNINSNKSFENEQYLKLSVGPIGKPLKLESYMYYPKKGKNKYDKELQTNFYAGKGGIENFTFLAVFRFKEESKYEVSSTSNGEYFDPSFLNCFYVLVHLKNSLYMLKFNNSLDLLKKIDLHLNFEIQVENLFWTPMFSFSDTTQYDSFELKYHDKESGFLCRISKMETSNKLEYSTLSDSLISQIEWENFMLLNDKRKLILYRFSNFEKIVEYEFPGTTKCISTTDSTSIFCTIDNKNLKIFKNSLPGKDFILINELKVGFDFDLDKIEFLGINENNFGVLIKEKKEEAPLKCKFFVLDDINKSKDSFEFQLEYNYWNPTCVVSPDKGSYLLFGFYLTRKIGSIKGVKIVRLNLNGSITNNTVSKKELKKDISFIRPPSEIGTSMVNAAYAMEFVPSIEDYYFDNKGDFWMILNRQGFYLSYLNKMFLLLKSNETKLQYSLIRNKHLYLIKPSGFFFEHESDPNKVLYVQVEKTLKQPISNNIKQYFRFYGFNLETNKFELETTLEDDNCIFLANNTREIYYDFGYFNGNVENGVTYTINTWYNEYEMISFLPGENYNQVKLIGKQKGANTLQLVTVDMSNLQGYIFHPLEIESEVLNDRLEYAKDNNYGLMHIERILSLRLKVLEKLLIIYNSEF